MNLKPSYNPEQRIIINEFLRTKLEETGAQGVVLGLSGGLDSSTVAVLAAEALGKEKVLCLMMPYDKEMDRESTDHALELVEKFGLDHRIISIRDSVDSIIDLANLDDVQKKVDMTAAGNVRARVRMVTLYYFANLNNFLVLGTSNKSEIMVGYFTKYGDGGTDAMPIGDLYKTQVFQLARELGIPDVILEKPPTAGLVRDQTDEKDLGITYQELDRILRGIELWMSLEDIEEITGIDIETVKRIHKMVYRSAHKRYLGMIPKLGLRTPGYDWRESVSLLSFSHEPSD